MDNCINRKKSSDEGNTEDDDDDDRYEYRREDGRNNLASRRSIYTISALKQQGSVDTMSSSSAAAVTGVHSQSLRSFSKTAIREANEQLTQMYHRIVDLERDECELRSRVYRLETTLEQKQHELTELARRHESLRVERDNCIIIIANLEEKLSNIRHKSEIYLSKLNKLETTFRELFDDSDSSESKKQDH